MKIEKIDDWNGNVIPGDPQYMDLVRVTDNGGGISEYRYNPDAVTEELPTD